MTESRASRARVLREVTCLDRDFAPAWTRLGAIELKLGEEGGDGFGGHFHATEHALKQAPLERPNEPVAVQALASVFMRTGQTAAAIGTLLAGLESRPDSTALHTKLGYAFLTQGCLTRQLPSIAWPRNWMQDITI